jgi:hypothetical protein
MNLADLFTFNWWAVLACVPVSMAVGSVWYNPKTFFTAWWKVVGKEDERPGGKSMGLLWSMTVLASLVQAVFMALALNAASLAFGGANALTGLAVGFAIWLGFVAPTYLVNKLFAGHGLKIWAIEVLNHLVDFLAFGAILGAWR